jgi:hypothetical protein
LGSEELPDLPCYYIILMVPAAIITLTASGVVRDLHLPQDARYITMLIVGFGFPGWAWLVHFGVHFALAWAGVEGHTWNLQESDMTAPYHIALTAGISGLFASVVFGWALRSMLVAVSMGSVSIASGLVCLLSPTEATIPPGLIAGIVIWLGLCVAALRLWAAMQKSIVARSESSDTRPPAPPPSEISTF